jgi:hypothetical protein
VKKLKIEFRVHHKKVFYLLKKVFNSGQSFSAFFLFSHNLTILCNSWELSYDRVTSREFFSYINIKSAAGETRRRA